MYKCIVRKCRLLLVIMNLVVIALIIIAQFRVQIKYRFVSISNIIDVHQFYLSQYNILSIVYNKLFVSMCYILSMYIITCHINIKYY